MSGRTQGGRAAGRGKSATRLAPLSGVPCMTSGRRAAVGPEFQVEFWGLAGCVCLSLCCACAMCAWLRAGLRGSAEGRRSQRERAQRAGQGRTRTSRKNLARRPCVAFCVLCFLTWPSALTPVGFLARRAVANAQRRHRAPRPRPACCARNGPAPGTGHRPVRPAPGRDRHAASPPLCLRAAARRNCDGRRLAATTQRPSRFTGTVPALWPLAHSAPPRPPLAARRGWGRHDDPAQPGTAAGDLQRPCMRTCGSWESSTCPPEAGADRSCYDGPKLSSMSASRVSLIRLPHRLGSLTFRLASQPADIPQR